MRKFVLSLLAIGLVGAVGCGRKPSTGIVVDHALAPLIAPDTKALAGIDLQKLKSTAVLRET